MKREKLDHERRAAADRKIEQQKAKTRALKKAVLKA